MRDFICLIFAILVLSCVGRKKDYTKDRVTGIDRYKIKIDSINALLEWKPLKEGLYISKNGDIGFKTVEMTEEGVSIDHYLKQLCCDGIKLKSVIDTASFEFMGSSFYRDKNNVYTHYDMADGGNFWIVGADVKTFEILGNCYARDKNHIYGERAMVMDSVDYASFRTSKAVGCFAKDKKGYLFWDERMTPEELLDESGDSLLLLELKKL
jgi:hypothetical protein